MIADFTAAGFHFGCACSTSADTPAICGVAIDVPLSVVAWLPLPTSVETIATPGAVTSGFSFASGERGPVEVNEAIPGTIGIPSVNEIAMPSRCTRAKPSDVLVVARPFTPKNGMVTVYCSPVSGFSVICPSKGGRVLALLIITTAAAPACWPKMARATRAQTPRCTTAILPATPAATYSAGSQPSEMAPAGVLSTLIGSAPLGSDGAPLALIA